MNIKELVDCVEKLQKAEYAFAKAQEKYGDDKELMEAIDVAVDFIDGVLEGMGFV